jgi:hypothetical protein
MFIEDVDNNQQYDMSDQVDNINTINGQHLHIIISFYLFIFLDIHIFLSFSFFTVLSLEY